MSVIASQVGAVALRSITRTARQPASAIPPILFPVSLMLVNAAGLDASTRLPGFPTDSFLAFALAVPFIQGALFATMNAGTDLARDIQTGFLNRLALTPMRGAALIAGQLGGIALMGFVQAVYYLAVGLAAGVRLETGVPGVIVLLSLATLIAISFGTLGAFFALRTGSGESVQGLFPLLFVLLFLSSMNLPRNLIETDWFRWVATINPVSYLVEAVRALVIYDWHWEPILIGFAVAIGMSTSGFILASHAWIQRMART